jgi:mannose-6-phosphate isomerase-like protein (cupin superfamily)
VDVAAARETKLAAIAAHRTQLPGGDPRALFPAGIVDRLLGAEQFEDASGAGQPLVQDLLRSIQQAAQAGNGATLGAAGDGLDNVVTAPDGSEVRPLLQVGGGSMVECTLPPGAVTGAVRHRTVEELWYFLEGEGEVWRSSGATNEVTPVRPGIALSIPLGTAFQFRATGLVPLRFVIVTIPPWPGADEVTAVEGRWTPTVLP